MKLTPLALAPLALLAAVAGCGGGTARDPDSGVDAPIAVDAAPPDAGQTGCPREPGPADRTRKVVVARPFLDDGLSYEVYDLTVAGALTATGDTFSMGRAFLGEIAFTPDGEVGIAVADSGDDQGTLGVFRFDEEGHPVVVHAAWNAGGAEGFWADHVVMAADGAHAYVLNAQWRVHGGGVHRVAIGCDGSLTYEGLVAAAKLPSALTLFAGEERALVAASDILDQGVESGNSAYLLEWGASPEVVAGVDAFGDDEASVSSAALTADGRFFLVADNNGFYSDEEMRNRVAAVEVTADGLVPTQVVTPIDDPIAVVPSPDDDAVLVVSGMGDALILVDYAAAAEPPFALVGEIDYADATGTQLPSGARLIERGTLRGRVLVAELEGIRQIQFEGDGTVTDLGLTEAGDGGSLGAIGVQP